MPPTRVEKLSYHNLESFFYYVAHGYYGELGYKYAARAYSTIMPEQ
jgi:hypothetical protein